VVLSIVYFYKLANQIHGGSLVCGCPLLFRSNRLKILMSYCPFSLLWPFLVLKQI